MAELMTSFELEEFLESIDLVGIRFLSSLKGRFWLEELREVSLSLAIGVAPLFIVLVVKFELYKLIYLNKINERQLLFLLHKLIY